VPFFGGKDVIFLGSIAPGFEHFRINAEFTNRFVALQKPGDLDPSGRLVVDRFRTEDPMCGFRAVAEYVAQSPLRKLDGGVRAVTRFFG
jgi:hypothetical protein